eukprot:COSAG06_NODE_46376_length_347_cov_1.016129_1_plen_98_part_01
MSAPVLRSQATHRWRASELCHWTQTMRAVFCTVLATLALASGDEPARRGTGKLSQQSEVSCLCQHMHARARGGRPCSGCASGCPLNGGRRALYRDLDR